MTKAAQAYQEAVHLLSAIGADRGAAQLWFDLADLLEQVGQAEAARDAYKRAAASTGPARADERPRADAGLAAPDPRVRYSPCRVPCGQGGSGQQHQMVRYSVFAASAGAAKPRRATVATATATTSFLAVAFMSFSWGACIKGVGVAQHPSAASR